jgi:8-oxo-dGTP pyrophosphatase MutT (NUDIX family)
MGPLAEQLRPLLLTAAQAAELDVHGGTDAAVLVALFESAEELHCVFTRRRGDLRRHAGEISFPGGRQDPGEDLRDTALREAEEEIGLPRDAVNIVGALTPTPTLVTSYAVYPFVGVIETGHSWAPQASEVEDVLELPLLALRQGHSRQRLLRRGVPFPTDVYEVEGAFIWGATARMLRDLFERLEPLLD